MVKTKDAILNYLIEPSPLFLKQVVDVVETKAYFLVRDLRKVKNRIIPDKVTTAFESRLKQVRTAGFKDNEYDGVNYLLIAKETAQEVGG
jgi:hypothetical protein